MKYNFDEIMDRKDNFSAKYDEAGSKFGRYGFKNSTTYNRCNGRKS